MTLTAEARTTTRRRSWVAVAVAGSGVAMVLGPQGPLGGFWGAPGAEELGISGGLLVAFLAYGIVESVVFGLGLAWLLFGRGYLASGALGTAAFAAIGWTLISWFPHGSSHMALAHDDYRGLALIEYGFHVTMMAAAIVIALYLIRGVRTGLAGGAR